MFNEIDENFDDMAIKTLKVGLPTKHDLAIKTLKVGLPTKHDLRKSLIRKPVGSVRQLMDRINEYEWVEEYQ